MPKIDLLLKYKNIRTLYKTPFQFWGITFFGQKKRLSKKDFNLLLEYKILINYKQSKSKKCLLNNQKPLLKWVGSKKKQSSFIVSKVPSIIDNYYEPFLGSATILLELLLKINLGKITLRGNIYTSDLNPLLINFYNVIKLKVIKFSRFIKKILYVYNNLTTIECKSNFYYKMRDKLNNCNLESLSVKSAILFYFINKSCFRGLYRTNKKGEFNVPFGNYCKINFDLNSFIEFYGLVKNVFFSCFNYVKCLSRVSEKDFIYLDPPYFGKKMFVDYLKMGFNYLEFFDFIKHLEIKNFTYLLSNILDKELLSIFSNKKYEIFYLEFLEGMINKKEKRKEVLISFRGNLKS